MELRSSCKTLIIISIVTNAAGALLQQPADTYHNIQRCVQTSCLFFLFYSLLFAIRPPAIKNSSNARSWKVAHYPNRATASRLHEDSKDVLIYTATAASSAAKGDNQLSMPHFHLSRLHHIQYTKLTITNMPSNTSKSTNSSQ